MAHRWKVLTVVSVAVFVVGLDMFIVNLAFPQIHRDFRGSSLASISWVLNAYAIVFAALLVPVGRTADRIGRRRGFLIGLIVFVAGSALCGAAPSVAALVGARALQAVGAAALVPTALALLLPEFPPAERPAAIGVWAAVGGVAAACGPPLGGLLVQISWRMVFLVNLPVGALALVFAVRLLQESRDPSHRRPDMAGAGLLMLAVALLTLGLVKAPDWGWGDVRTVSALVGAAAGLAGFWVRCQSHPVPVVEPSLLRVRSFAVTNTSSLLFSAGFSAMLLGNVLFMTQVWHESALTAGFALMPGPATAALVAAPAGRLGGRVGQRRLAVAGTALFALGGTWYLWRLGSGPDYAGEMLPGQLITGAGVGLTLPSLASAAAASLPPARFATGSAVFTMSRQVGFALGVAVFVAALGTASVRDPSGSFDAGWIVMVAAGALASLTATLMGEVRPYAATAAAGEAPPPEPAGLAELAGGEVTA